MLRTLAVCTMVCALALSANAQPRSKERGGGYQKQHQGQSHNRGERGHSYGRGPRVIIQEDPLAGFLGGVLGGWLGSQGSDDEEEEPRVEEEPVAIKPFSPLWYETCSNRYRSFDPRTGFYISLPNYVPRFCTVMED